MRDDSDQDRILTMFGAAFDVIRQLTNSHDERNAAVAKLIEWYLTDNHSTDASGTVAYLDCDLHELRMAVLFDSECCNDRSISRLKQLGEALRDSEWLTWSGDIEIGFTKPSMNIYPKEKQGTEA